MVQKNFVIDSVQPYSDRRGTKKLIINLAPPDVVQNGVTMVQAGMPTSLEIPDYTADDLAKWEAGAGVTATFDVSTAPSESTSKS